MIYPRLTRSRSRLMSNVGCMSFSRTFPPIDNRFKLWPTPIPSNKAGPLGEVVITKKCVGRSVFFPHLRLGYSKWPVANSQLKLQDTESLSGGFKLAGVSLFLQSSVGLFLLPRRPFKLRDANLARGCSVLQREAEGTRAP